MERRKLKMVVESLVFVSEEPISIKRLIKLIGNVEREELKEAIEELRRDCLELERGIILVDVADGYQFRTPPGSAKYISKMFEGKPQRLTRASLETLAIIAYNQPLVRSEVERIRGVDSGGVLKTLLERDLIRIVGRQDAPGRPALYGTTDTFLEFFGLKNLSEMPDLREITELGDAAEENIADEAQGRETDTGEEEGGRDETPSGEVSSEEDEESTSDEDTLSDTKNENENDVKEDSETAPTETEEETPQDQDVETDLNNEDDGTKV